MAKTKLSSFRLTDLNLAHLDELAEHWKANRTETLNMAVHLAREVTGLIKQDAVSAMEKLARHYGDDARITATVTRLDGGEATVTINSATLAGWTAGLSVASAGFTNADEPAPRTVGSMMLRHDETGTFFSFGQMSDPQPGSEFSARVADLPELVVLRAQGKNPGDVRRDIKNELWLRRNLRAAMGDTDFDINHDDEEAPLDDDDA